MLQNAMAITNNIKQKYLFNVYAMHIFLIEREGILAMRRRCVPEKCHCIKTCKIKEIYSSVHRLYISIYIYIHIHT